MEVLLTEMQLSVWIMIFIIGKNIWRGDIYPVSKKKSIMNITSIYLAIVIIAGLAIILNLVFIYNRKEQGLSRLAGLAFAFVIAGIFLGGQRLLGYSLIGVGVILAIIDIILKSKSKVNS